MDGETSRHGIGEADHHGAGGTVRLVASPAVARRRALHAAIIERGFVSIADVAKEIGISEMTVRRDLDILKQEGAIERSHGGAVAARRIVEPAEPSFAARRNLRVGAKRAIARAAAELIGERETVGLDVGSTLAFLAGELRNRSGLSIVTNSVRVISALTDTPAMLPDVYVLGGYLRAREGSLCGAIAQRQLEDHWLSKAFIGTAGITTDGLFDYSVEEVQVTLAYMRHASEVIVLADSSKFDQRSFARVCGLGEITTLVTDEPPPPHLRDTLERNAVRVIVAPPLD